MTLTDISNPKAFEKVFHAYYRPLANFAFQYLQDHDEAEEIVQEAFSAIWQKREGLEIKTNLRSYLYGAVRNGCLNNLKHQKVIQNHEVYAMGQAEEDASDTLELDELQSMIDAALDQLPEKCRQIFEMSRYDGMKYTEIADELGISIKTVETQMSRALKVMRRELRHYLPVFLLWVIQAIENKLSG